MNRIRKFLKNPYKVFYKLNYLKLSRLLPDKLFLKLIFRAKVGYKLNLENPVTFNEKLQWLKLNNRDTLYSKLADKFEVREYIKEKIGEEHLIPLIGVWDKFDDIDFSQLPNQFVIKCTHDSGSVCICKDKESFDIKSAKKVINKALKQNFYYRGREWAYKNIKPRIVVEEYISDLSEIGVCDYKVFCFNGKPEAILLCKDRFSEDGLTIDFYDCAWNHMNFSRPVYYPHSKVQNKKPQMFDELLNLSTKLSKGIPFVRTDFYITRDEILFGELTFYPGDGFEAFDPELWDKKWGDLLKLKNTEVV